MAHVNKVMRSLETADGGRCVDLFMRPDGSFGFEEYRRDIEDGRGWFAIAAYGGEKFETLEAALAAARQRVAWLAATLDG
jgi:hypothetical protein